MSDPQTESLCLYAFDVSPDGQVTPVDENALTAPVPGTAAYRWVHLNLAHEDVARTVAALSDEVVARALTLEDTRPRADTHRDGVILNLRGVNLNPESDPEDMVSIRMWVTEKLIVSTRRRRLMAVVSLRQALEEGHGPKTTAEFVTDLAAGLTERMDKVIIDLADDVDDLEDQSLTETGNLRMALTELRQTTIMLRRYISPQREALGRFALIEQDILSEQSIISLRESNDRVTRFVEELDAIRERAAILHDQLTDRRAEELNQHMMVLSVVAAIFLPLGFLTGLLGINVGGIPMADSPFGFLTVCVLTVLIAIALLWLFRRLKWI